MRKLILAQAATAVLWAGGPVYPHRWVWVTNNLGNDEQVEAVRQIARTAAEHGLTAVVLSCSGLDRLDQMSPAFEDRVRQVKQATGELGLQLIPAIFSVGYGSSVLAHDAHLREALPVRDALFQASSGTAHLVADPPVEFVNGGLEQYDGETHKLAGYNLQDAPGVHSFIDTGTSVEGSASLRFEVEGIPNGNARLMQVVPVQPWRCYRVTVWVKTEGLAPAGGLRLQMLTPDTGRAVAPWTAGVPETGDWRQLTWGFNSGPHDSMRIYIGVWGGRSGRFWVDNFRIEEMGLLNVVRREGTPLAVRLDGSDTVFEEGVDYAWVNDPLLSWRFDHNPPLLRLLPESRVRDGDLLRVSWYHGMGVNNGQVTVCMSEEKIYRIWAEQARRLHELIAPARYLLNMDEIRMGGTCEACKRRGLSMAEILGDCITRQAGILREVNPDADVWIWSDMLDPNHNAVPDYYLVDGDYSGSWQYIPPDTGIVTWYYGRRVKSLEHFSTLGFRTLAGAYYDGGNLDNPLGWLEAMDNTPAAAGIMYTTWENDYGLLEGFGDLVSLRP